MKNHNLRALLLVSSGVLAIGAGGMARAAVIDYPANTSRSTPIVLTDNTTQLQVNAAPGGTAFQTGVISESGGSFGIEKIGAGTLGLGADNTYTGVTTITGGVLVLGVNTSPTGSIASMSIVDNAALFFNRSNAITYAGVISGTGQVGVGGTGITTLTGVNTYTGLTFVNSGATLALSGAGSIAASSSVSLNGGALDISATTAGASIKSLTGVAASTVILGSKTLTVTAGNGGFLGVISGTGGLRIAGGNQSLSGANTYTGGTTINPASTLTIGTGTALSGSVVGNITDNGTLAFNSTGAVTFANGVSGTGGLSQLNSGAVTLTGNNTYTGTTTIASGATLQIGIGGTAGSLGTGNVINNGTLAFNRTGVAVANNISGSGAVSISGGTTAISGAVTYTGVTTIASGSTLQLSNVSAPIASNIANSGSLIWVGSNGGNITGVISGTGRFQVNSGQISLKADNTYTGGTTLTGGSLTLGNGATGSVVGDIVNNGLLLSIDHSTATASNGVTTRTAFNATYAGVISGSSGVGFAGNNTLTAAQTYTGFTIQNFGTLILSGAGSIATTSSLELSGARNGGFDISAISAGGTSVGSLASCGNDRVKVTGVFVNLCSTDDDTGKPGSTVTLGSKTLTLTNASGNFLGVIGGTGGLTIAAGTETLSGINTYTGTTTISGGTLALSGSGSIAASSGVADAGTLDISGTTSGATIKTLSGAGTVALGAQTLTLSNASTTFSGVIQNTGITSGTGGGLTLAAGSFTLSGTSTYTGATTVSGGALNVTGSIGSSAVTVASGASLTGAGTVGALTVSGGGIVAPGNVAGTTGTLSVNGNLSLASTAITNIDVTPSAADKIAVTGTAAVAGTLNASFASGTYSTVTPYTLVSSTGALSGTFSSYNVTGLSTNYNSALSYNANNVLLLLSDAGLASGSTTNLNSGSVTVTGNQTSGGLSSSSSGGTVVLSSGATLTANQSDNTTYSGTITGAGGFAKAGTGTLILNGANTYTGGTAVNGGVLEVGDASSPGASINGPVTIGSGGTLSGHGTINGAVTVGAGGNFQPGGSIGTINVGSTTFAAGSTYTVETNAAGQGNNTVATGTITINPGTTLAVTPDAPLASYGRLTNYTILQAAGGISGTFSSVTNTSALFTSNVNYAPNVVTLTLVRPDLLATVATTANQTSIGTAIAASSGSIVLGFLAPQSDAAVRTAFNQLNGEIHASLRSAAVEDSRIIRDTVLDHLGKPSDSLMVWGAGFGGYGSISTDGNASGLHHDMAGFIAGVDMPVGEGFRLGVAGGYTGNNASVTGKTSTASGNSGHVIGYGGWSDGKIDLKLGGDFGFGTVNVTRTVASFAQVDRSSQDQNLAQVFAEGGYKFETARAMVEPYAGIASISVTTGGFAETGGSTALSGNKRTDTQTYSTLGLRASLAPMSLTDSLGGFTPHVDMAWQHGFNVLRPAQAQAIAGLTQGFTVLGAPLASDAAAVRAGFDLAITPEAVLSLDYDGSFASRVQNNAVRGTVAWRF